MKTWVDWLNEEKAVADGRVKSVPNRIRVLRRHHTGTNHKSARAHKQNKHDDKKKANRKIFVPLNGGGDVFRPLKIPARCRRQEYNVALHERRLGTRTHGPGQSLRSACWPLWVARVVSG